jgi:hypothetical protein
MAIYDSDATVVNCTMDSNWVRRFLFCRAAHVGRLLCALLLVYQYKGVMDGSFTFDGSCKGQHDQLLLPFRELATACHKPPIIRQRSRCIPRGALCTLRQSRQLASQRWLACVTVRAVVLQLLCAK